MTTSKKPKAKAKSAAKAKPAKIAKKPAAPKKAALRKAPAKHTTKAKAPSAVRGDDQYLKFSGKFTVRLPKSLHQALVERAEKEGVSLNLFVTNALSRTVAVSGAKKK